MACLDIFKYPSSWIFDNTKISDCHRKLLAFGRSSVSTQPFLVYEVHPFLGEWTRENFVSPYSRGRRTGSEETSQLDSTVKYSKATNNPGRSTTAFIDCVAEKFSAPNSQSYKGLPWRLSSKESACNAGNAGGAGLILGREDPLEEDTAT